jgi:hypothetical protein
MKSAMLLGAALGAMPTIAAAQSALGAPFIGRNHLSFYATELSDDGIGSASSTLYGGRYARRFGRDDAATRFSFMVQGAARQLPAPNDGVVDLSATAAWTRRMAELTPALSVTAAVGASVLGWGAGRRGVGHRTDQLPGDRRRRVRPAHRFGDVHAVRGAEHRPVRHPRAPRQR